ncbi:MAG: hypothetical protein WGN25_09070 [Candidatus Electrothrix sp. GW3-4]|uniref:hypothetical protein n=1 Tax=Candidatus Electrothrix sp. GW3-4 TaxID=3126740 RepID=UPI0030CE6E78
MKIKIKRDIEFDSDLFVNRKDEKELLGNILNGEEKEKHFLEFTGISGQGKTELLKYFFTETIKGKKWLAAYIDLNEPQFYRPEIYPILQEVVDDFSGKEKISSHFNNFNERLNSYIEELQKYHRQLWDVPETADRKPIDRKEEELLNGFTIILQDLLREYKIVICFDSTERACPSIIHRLEEQILLKFIDNNNFIAIFAGQQRWGWISPTLRRRVKRHQMQRLSLRDTEEFVDRLLSQNHLSAENKSDLLNKLWMLTLGHPFSSYTFLDFLSAGFRKIVTAEIINEHYNRSIQELIDKVIKNRVLEKLELSSKYPSPEAILSCLAPLRRIEFSTFHFILSRFLPGSFKDQSFSFFHDLITEFQNKIHIFTPWTLGAGFDLEEVTRNILLLDLRINHKEKFIEIQRALIEQYDRWIEQTRDASQIKNIVERLYHTTLLMTEERVENITQNIAKKLKEYLNSYFTKEYIGDEYLVRDQIGRLKNVLERDKELCLMIDVTKLLEIIESV